METDSPADVQAAPAGAVEVVVDEGGVDDVVVGAVVVDVVDVVVVLVAGFFGLELQPAARAPRSAMAHTIADVFLMCGASHVPSGHLPSGGRFPKLPARHYSPLLAIAVIVRPGRPGGTFGAHDERRC
jgi:hypothetical protein